MFKSFFQAGFESAILPWSSRDMQYESRHTPDRAMAANYGRVRNLGIRTVRDGLGVGPMGDWVRRFFLAKKCEMEVIWDLVHFNLVPGGPVSFCRDIADAWHAVHEDTDTIWICPVNEPTISAQFNNVDRRLLARQGVEVVFELRQRMRLPGLVKVMQCEPLVGAGDDEYACLDFMVREGVVDVIGVNYYPHTSVDPLDKVLCRTWDRYGLPILVSETSLHLGHPHPNHQRTKPEWLRGVYANVNLARARGVEVVGINWFPAIDSPDWNDESNVDWNNGLMTRYGEMHTDIAGEIWSLGQDELFR